MTSRRYVRTLGPLASPVCGQESRGPPTPTQGRGGTSTAPKHTSPSLHSLTPWPLPRPPSHVTSLGPKSPAQEVASTGPSPSWVSAPTPAL